MSAADIVQITLAAATLVSALAGLVVAVRTGQKTSATHELVNGASTQLNALREAQGFREGVDSTNLAAKVAATRTVPPTGRP